MFTHPTAHSSATARQGTRRGHLKRSSSGFTLLEVLMAMALITFVMSGVYGISGAAVELGRSMNTARVEETRVTNFVSVWRDYFESLPPDIVFSSGVDTAGFGRSGAILIEGGPAPFAWHPSLRLAPAVELAVVGRQGEQHLVVRHLREPERGGKPGDYDVMAELALLENVETMRWQFFDAEAEEWFGTWNPKDRARPPLFLKMEFRLSGDPRTHEQVYWVANDLAGVTDPTAPSEGQGTPGGVPPQPGVGPAGVPPSSVPAPGGAMAPVIQSR